jgi:hypothetical protein
MFDQEIEICTNDSTEEPCPHYHCDRCDGILEGKYAYRVDLGTFIGEEWEHLEAAGYYCKGCFEKHSNLGA